MSRTICCPSPTALASVVTTLNPCVSDVGQIQKFVFWRSGNSIASIATALVEATWTTLLAATGDTKALVSPFVSNVTIPVSEPREFGGGNETKNGSPIRKGANSVPVNCAAYQEEQTVITNLKKLACESLEVLFINESNQLIYNDDSGAVKGFTVERNSLFVSDKGIGGLTDPDSNNIMFNFAPNWSDNLKISAASTFLLSMVNA